MNKNIKVALIVFVVLILGVLIFYYSFQPKSPSPPNPAQKLTEMSQSLTVQEQTPQFRSKLDAMSKSLNKK